MRLRSDGVGSICGRLILGTAETIAPAELVDSTGAGDAFIAAVLYGELTLHSPYFFPYLVSSLTTFSHLPNPT